MKVGRIARGNDAKKLGFNSGEVSVTVAQLDCVVDGILPIGIDGGGSLNHRRRNKSESERSVDVVLDDLTIQGDDGGDGGVHREDWLHLRRAESRKQTFSGSVEPNG